MGQDGFLRHVSATKVVCVCVETRLCVWKQDCVCGNTAAVLAVCRARGDLLVALKEIPLTDIGIFGATDAERESGIASMNKEVGVSLASRA
eukprot:350160-Chlamydomonas_euryale.AAC.1